MPQSKVKYMIDAETVMAPNGTNIAAASTVLSGSVALPRENGLEGHPDAVAQGQFAFVAIVEAFFFSTNEAYTLDIVVSDDSALTVNVATVGSIIVDAVGIRTVILDSENIDAIAEATNTGAAPAFIGVSAVVAGSAPDLTYEAFLAPTAND